MDFIGELLVQLIVQFVLEFVFEIVLHGAFHGAKRVLGSHRGRLTVSALVGLGFGLAWGSHLSNQPSAPKLLWVSLALAFAAVVLIRRHANPRQLARRIARGSFLRQTFTPPWNWPISRLIDFVVLNVAIAAGVSIGYWAL
jgi:hypothetical protein